MSEAERRARAWYAQTWGRPSWDDLSADDQQRFIRNAGSTHRGRCNAPECGGDCLECFVERATTPPGDPT